MSYRPALIGRAAAQFSDLMRDKAIYDALMERIIQLADAPFVIARETSDNANALSNPVGLLAEYLYGRETSPPMTPTETLSSQRRPSATTSTRGKSSLAASSRSPKPPHFRPKFPQSYGEPPRLAAPLDTGLRAVRPA
ncbi:MAG TPA: hypothetical protein VN840_20975 [Streptosporangiaceae bacterium]|nr:hypothetical protein [Streptosporangiaceae bacterium]